jgi:hypothetical protein
LCTALRRSNAHGATQQLYKREVFDVAVSFQRLAIS